MDLEIRDGAGKGNRAKVDANNRLHIQSVSETEALAAIEVGVPRTGQVWQGI